MNDNKMVVIGSGGQLGTDFCNEACSSGYDVEAVDYPQIDITRKESVNKLILGSNASIVVNCAAFTAVDDCEKEKEKAFDLNAAGPEYIATACSEAGSRMVHISTDYVFSGDKKSPYIESDQPDPQSVYGQSKLLGEQKVIASCKNHQIFRIAWLYGHYGKNFVFTIRAAAHKKAGLDGILKVVNDQVGTPTSTIEVCRQILTAQKSDLTGIFHTTCEGACSWFDFASLIIKSAMIPVSVLPCTTEEFLRPAPRPKNSVLENQRLKEAGISVMSDWQTAFNNFLTEESVIKENACTR